MTSYIQHVDCFNCRPQISLSEDAGIEPRTISDSFADPDPGSGAFLSPGSGIGKKSGSGSGMNNPDDFPSAKKQFFWVKICQFFDADPGSGMEKIRILDPRWKKFGSGIRDKHPGSATLISEPA